MRSYQKGMFLFLFWVSWLSPTLATAAWTGEPGNEPCNGLSGSPAVIACRNIFTGDGAQDTPVLTTKLCDNITVNLHLSGVATATGFVQACSDISATTCTDLHTTPLNGTTVLGYTHGGPVAYIRGRMTGVVLGAGTAQLKAVCAEGK